MLLHRQPRLTPECRNGVGSSAELAPRRRYELQELTPLLCHIFYRAPPLPSSPRCVHPCGRAGGCGATERHDGRSSSSRRPSRGSWQRRSATDATATACTGCRSLSPRAGAARCAQRPAVGTTEGTLANATSEGTLANAAACAGTRAAPKTTERLAASVLPLCTPVRQNAYLPPLYRKAWSEVCVGRPRGEHLNQDELGCSRSRRL